MRRAMILHFLGTIISFIEGKKAELNRYSYLAGYGLQHYHWNYPMQFYKKIVDDINLIEAKINSCFILLGQGINFNEEALINELNGLVSSINYNYYSLTSIQ